MKIFEDIEKRVVVGLTINDSTLLEESEIKKNFILNHPITIRNYSSTYKSEKNFDLLISEKCTTSEVCDDKIEGYDNNVFKDLLVVYRTYKPGTSAIEIDILYESNKKKITFIVKNGSEVDAFSSDVLISNSSVEKVRAHGKSHISAHDNCEVSAYDESVVSAYDEVYVLAQDNSTVYLYNSAVANAGDNTKVFARGNSEVDSFDYSVIYLGDGAFCEAKGYSKVLADCRSFVKVFDQCEVTASAFSVVHVFSEYANVIEKNHYGTVIRQIFTVKEDMLVYKKLFGNLIATLKLEKGQVFQSEFHNKCRTDRAYVVRIDNGDEDFLEGISLHDSTFVYTVGEYAEPSIPYDKNIAECSYGIHFFLTREAAENFKL